MPENLTLVCGHHRVLTGSAASLSKLHGTWCLVCKAVKQVAAETRASA